MKVGFVVWNPFMVYHMKAIAEFLDDPCFLVLDFQPKVKVLDLFGPDPSAFIGFDFQEIRPEDFRDLDGELAAVVCPNPIAGMEYLDRTKCVGLQYSMAKDRYVNGPWRAMFDMTLTYGRYSAERIAHFCPTRMVGNPRFHRWFSGADSGSAGDGSLVLDDSRPTVLYLPTWGEFSSVDQFMDAVLSLSESYNVLVKVHHKTETHESRRRDALSNQPVVRYFGATDDLLPLLRQADLVLSDYSGAIFDAIYVRKPVVLLQSDPSSVIGKKFGYESIEYARREDIGAVVSIPDDLARAVDAVISGSIDYSARNERLRSETFEYDKNSGLIAARAITDFLEAPGQRPMHQTYLRDELRVARLDKRAKQQQLQELKNELRVIREASHLASVSSPEPIGAGRRWGAREIALDEHKRAGQRYELQLNWLAAAGAYRSALQYSPKDPELHARLGYVLEQSRNWRDAAAAFEAALKCTHYYD